MCYFVVSANRQAGHPWPRLHVFETNNPRSLEHAQRIMSHYDNREIYSNFDARRATFRAIKEWQRIFTEWGIDERLLSTMICVKPVFSQNQLDRLAGASLIFYPNAIGNSVTGEAMHILSTRSDGQCCVLFSADNSLIESIEKCMEQLTLREYLQQSGVEYLLR